MEESKEMDEFLNLNYKDQVVNTYDNMLKYLRKVQQAWLKGESKVSGVDLLHTLVQDGTITTSMFLKTIEAVKNPEIPYEIIKK